MTTIGSIGIGLFILILVWIPALLVLFFAVRAQSNVGWFALGFTTLVTVVLVAIPTEKSEHPLESIITIEKDYSYIYRNILLVALISSACIASFFFVILHCLEPIRIKPVKHFIQTKSL